MADQVVAVLKALYHNSEASGKQEASKWLEQWQKSVNAWELLRDAHVGVEMVTMEMKYFAAQTLQAKIKYDWNELPPASHESLRSTLFGLLDVYKEGQQVIQTRLCLAIVWLMIHMEGWVNPIPEVIDQLGKSPTHIPILLDILTLFPEEVLYTRVVTRNRRNDILNSLVNVAGGVVTYLQNNAALFGSNATAYSKILRAFESWAKLDVIPAEELSRSQLLGATFEAIKTPELFEVASDVIVGIVKAMEDPTRHMAIIDFMFPRIMALRPMYQAAKGEEEHEKAESLCRIFVEMGDCYMDFIIQPNQQSLEVLAILLDCTNHDDPDICYHTFGFWYDLSTRLTQDHEDRISFFRPSFEQLVPILVQRMRFDEGFATESPEDQEDFKRFRYKVGLVLKDVCAVIGAEYVATKSAEMVTHFMNQPNKKWEDVEAPLYALRSIESKLPRDNMSIVPGILSMLTSLPNEGYILYTALLIIGKYADWLRHHTESISPLLTFVINGLTLGGEVAGAAALAFKEICESCSDILASNFQDLLQVYASVQTQALETEDHLEIIQGLCTVVSTFAEAELRNGVQAILQPLVARLTQHVQSLTGEPMAENRQQSKDPWSITGLSRRFCAVFQYACQYQNNRSHPSAGIMVEAFKSCWLLFDNLIQRHVKDPQVMEQLCRSIKYTFKNGRHYIGPFMQTMLEKLVQGFQTVPHSCFMYAASAAVQYLGNFAEYQQLLLDVLNHFSTHTFTLLQTMEGFTNHPDVVEEYFEFGKQYIYEMPLVIIPNPIMHSMFDCGLVGMQLQHRQAARALYSFFVQFVKAGVPPGEGPLHPAIQSFLDQNNRGQTLILNVFLNLSGNLPSSQVSDAAQILTLTKSIDAQKFQMWFQHAVASLKLPLSDQDKMSFQQTVLENSDVRLLKGILNDFRDECGRGS